jgi:cell division protein FtsQ
MELSLPFPRRVQRRRSSASNPAHRPGIAAYLHDRLAGNRRALRATVCLLVLVPLLGGSWLWLRNSSLVGVRHVHITGVHGADSIAIRSALSDAARRMSTMHFDQSALRAAVAAYPIVAAIHLTTSFPHTVRISVTERPPVAALLSAGQRTAVAADGTVLGPAWLSSSLPVVDGSVEPAPGGQLKDAEALADVAVLGAAPKPLLGFVTRVYKGPEGLTVKMRNGLLVYFGDATRPHAKWLSLARVLSSPSSAGAWYIDVRLPERPAAGMSGAGSATSTPTQSTASDPTAAALAASLSHAVNGEPESTSGSTTPEGSGGSESTEASGEGASGESESSSGEASSGASSSHEEASTNAESTP